MRVIFEDGDFCLQENCNAHPGTGNLFLLRTNVSDFRSMCIGGADWAKGGWWIADVLIPYDVATDTDVRELGRFSTQQEAAEALWRARHTIDWRVRA